MRSTRAVLNFIKDEITDLKELYKNLEKADTKIDAKIFKDDFKKNKDAYLELQNLIDQLDNLQKDKSLVYIDELHTLTMENLANATTLQADYLCRLINLTNSITSEELREIYQVGYFKALPIMDSIIEERIASEFKTYTNSSTNRIFQCLPEAKPSLTPSFSEAAVNIQQPPLPSIKPIEHLNYISSLPENGFRR